MRFKETKLLIENFISKGNSFIDIKNNSKLKTQLVAEYIAELDKGDSLFEDQEPGRFLLSRFLTAQNAETTQRIADELTDCIFSANDTRIEELFNEVEYELELHREEIDDNKLIDNLGRYRDAREYTRSNYYY